VKNCCGAETVGIMVSNGEQIIIYNEVVVALIDKYQHMHFFTFNTVLV